MGVSSDGILVYGYDIGELEDSLYGVVPEDYDDDFREWVEDKLLESVGFTEQDWEAEGYFDRKREAENRLGVEVVVHCSYEYPMYILGIKGTITRAWRGSPQLIANLDVHTEWGGTLRDAALLLGIELVGDPGCIRASVMG
jgi:hypothetical protein